MSEQPRAWVEMVNGQPVLHDPDALAMIKAVARHNCRNTLLINKDRAQHFEKRMTEKGLAPADVVIVILNVDDENGGQLANILMPEMDWQAMRDQGLVPFARGLAVREGIAALVTGLDPEIGEKLKAISGVAAVVMDHGVVECFEAREWAEG